MLNIDEILELCDAGRPPCGDIEYICVSRKDITQFAAEHKALMEVTEATHAHAKHFECYPPKDNHGPCRECARRDICRALTALTGLEG